MADAKLNFPITATDDTARGTASAGKRFSELSKQAGRVGSDPRGTRQFVKNVSVMEKASAKAFGGRSAGATGIIRSAAVMEKAAARFASARGLGGSVGRFSEMRDRAQTFGSVQAEGGGGGSGLGGLMGVVGGFAEAVGAVAAPLLALAAAAAVAVASVQDWAKTTSGLGRLSDATGVAAKSIDAMVAAAETEGIDRAAAQNSIKAFAEAISDAKYGRNQTALGAMSQFGIREVRDADGKLDIRAMYGQLADVVKRQKDPIVGARVAEAFGQGAFLPLLQKGGAGVQREYDRGGREGLSRDNNDTANARQFTYGEIRAKQIAARKIGSGDAITVAGTVGALNAAGHINDYAGIAMREAPHVLDQAVRGISAGAGQVGHALGSGAGIVSAGFGGVRGSLTFGARKVEAGFGDVTAATQRIAKMLNAAAAEAFTFFRSRGDTVEQAAGRVASLYSESKFDPTAPGDGGRAYGIGQWHPDRQKRFKLWAGHDIRGSTLQEQLAFVVYEHGNGEEAAGRNLARATTGYGAATVEVDNYERPKNRELEKERRGRLAEQIVSAVYGGRPKPTAPEPFSTRRDADVASRAPLLPPRRSPEPAPPGAPGKGGEGGAAGAPGAPAPTGRVQVDIKLHGAPMGTVTSVSSAKDIDVRVEHMNVGRP